MLQELSELLIDQIDEITRRWVDALRRTERTEIHNQLLTAEIVDGVKVMLAAMADAMATHETPEHDTLPIITVPRLTRTLEGSARTRPAGTAPLSGPLTRAKHAAAAHGLLRHTQDYEIHEVLMEYIKLRQILFESLRENLPTARLKEFGTLTPYIDRLLDELMLATVESFYHTSVRDLEKRALRDPLTQLYNKEYFAQRLSEELRRALRTAEPLSVAMIDMDMLKNINDTYGHPAGDAVIAAIASAIYDTCRRSDVPCRYGGDEFAVILPETNKVQGRVFAERVMRAIRGLTVVVTTRPTPATTATSATTTLSEGDLASTGGSQPLLAPVPTVSVGLATFPGDARNPETLLAQADAALYRAKRSGRNKIAF